MGDVVGSWNVSLEYDEAADLIRLFARKPGTRWTKEKRWTVTYAPDEIEEAIETVALIVRTAGARRLF